jgi:hypothetical protein
VIVVRKMFVIMLALVLVVSGCGTQKAESGKAAIQTAKTMETAQEKTDYLVSQAKAFYNSKEFQDAVDTAQYVLRYLDRDSQEARDMLKKAKDALIAQTRGAAKDAKKKLGF